MGSSEGRLCGVSLRPGHTGCPWPLLSPGSGHLPGRVWEKSCQRHLQRTGGRPWGHLPPSRDGHSWRGLPCPRPCPFQGPVSKDRAEQRSECLFSLCGRKPSRGKTWTRKGSRASSVPSIFPCSRRGGGGLAISDQLPRPQPGALYPEPLKGLGFQRLTRQGRRRALLATARAWEQRCGPRLLCVPPTPTARAGFRPTETSFSLKNGAGRARTRTWPCGLILLSKSDLGVLPACSQGRSSLPWCPHSVDCCGLAGWGTWYGRRAVALSSRRKHG